MLEPLEPRLPLVSDWQNPLLKFDVNDDGTVAPLDVLPIVNDLNASGSRRLESQFDDLDFLIDVDGDGVVAPQDVLLVVNRLNRSITELPAAMRLVSDTGDSATDRLTNNPELAGSITLGGASLVSAKGRLNRGSVFDVSVASDGQFTVDPKVIQTVTDGEFRFSIYVVDALGAEGLKQFRFQLDSTPPAFVPLALLADDDSGKYDDDGVTFVNRPRFSVAAEAGTSLLVALDGIPLFDGASPGILNSQTEVLADGAHGLTAIARDRAGNISSAELTLVIDTIAPPHPDFDLAPASDTGVRGDGITSSARVTLAGTTEANLFVSMGVPGILSRTNGDGTFRIPNVTLALGDNPFAIRATDLAGNTSDRERTIIREDSQGPTDPVLRWNQAIRDAIVLDATNPPMAARGMAMLSVAILDVVHAIERTPGYLVSLPAPTAISIEAAVSSAAFQVMNYLFPGQVAQNQHVHDSTLAEIPNGAEKSAGMEYGKLVGNAVVALRDRDGWRDFEEGSIGSEPGEWQPTAPMFAVPLLPQWGKLTPFAVRDVASLTPAGPPELSSQEWADNYAEVKSFGAATDSTRTPDQTQIARFWADGSGTVTPPGHWNELAAQFAHAEGLSLGENARLLAMLNIALSDAAVVAWNTKYELQFWRPITAIQRGDEDGNSQTQPDSNWRPLLITPPFPEYVSGHSTFSSAAAAILTDYFGDNQSFSLASGGMPGVTRNFTSFEQAAAEAGRSRIYGGIHYSFANDDGQAAGRAVADEVLARFGVADDIQAPTIVFLGSPSGMTTSLNPTIQGWALDNLAGVASVSVRLDAGAPQTVVMEAGGQFAFQPSFPLDGSSDGEHTLQFRVIDNAGLEGDFNYAFTLDTQAPQILISSPAPDASVSASLVLEGTASGTGSNLVSFDYSLDGARPVPLILPTGDGAFGEAVNLSKANVGPHTLTVTARDAAGNSFSQDVVFTLSQLAPFIVTNHTPTDGAEDVGVTFRPQIHFSRPVDVATLTSDNLFATTPAGTKVPATIVPARDGSFAWLFFTKPLPGSSTITVHVAGDTIQAQVGAGALDADNDGVAGGELTFQFSTVSVVPLPGTSLSGRVLDPGPDLKPMTYDDIRVGPDGILHTPDDVFLKPIAHAQVFILGLEHQAVFTDANGYFSFAAVPAGNIKLAIDGRTATNAPSDIFWPEMVMDLQMEAGRANTMMGTMGTLEQRQANHDRPEVYLPRIQTSILQPVSTSAVTEVGVDGVSAPNLTDEQRQQFKLQVQPGSILGPDGQPLANPQIGVSTVPPELVREMLPPGILQHTFDITIQAPGAATISSPIQMSLPNTFGAAPGTKLNLLSFDHTTGRLEIDGTATVSADGLSVTTDPDNGVTHPGWHGVTPEGSPTGDICDPAEAPDPTPSNARRIGEGESVAPTLITSGLKNTILYEDAQVKFWQFENRTLTHFARYACSKQLQPPKVVIDLTFNDDASNAFLERFLTHSITLLPGQRAAIPIQAKTLLSGTNISRYDNNELHGVRVKLRAHYLDDNGIEQDISHQLPATEYFVYRFVDVTDNDHRIKSRATDFDGNNTNPDEPGTIEFPRVLATADRSIRQTVNIDYKGDASARPMPEVVVGLDDFSWSGNSVSFNPTAAGIRNGALSLVAPNQQAFTIKLLGRSVNPTSLVMSRVEFSKTVASIIDDNLGPLTYPAFRLLFPSRSTDATFQKTVDELYDKITGKLRTIFSAFSPSGSFQIMDVPRGTAAGSAIRFFYTKKDGDPTQGKASVLADGNQFLNTNTAKSTFYSSPMSRPEARFVFSTALTFDSSAIYTDGTIHVYVDHIIGDNFIPGSRLDSFATEFANAIAHELGHNLGMIHVQSATQSYAGPTLMGQGGGSASSLGDYGPQRLPVALMAMGLPVDERTFRPMHDDYIKFLPYDTGEKSRHHSVEESHIDAPVLSIFDREPDLRTQQLERISSLDFGEIVVGEIPVNRTIYLAADGTEDVVVSKMSFSTDSTDLRISSGSFPLTVNALQSGTLPEIYPTKAITLTFTPTKAGEFLTSLDIVSNSSESGVIRIPVRAKAIAAHGTIAIDAKGRNMGGAKVGETVALADAYRIHNDGSKPLTITEIAVVGGTSIFQVQNGPQLPVVVLPGKGLAFGIRFSPNSSGLQREEIEIRSDDPEQPLIELSIVGTGVANAPANGAQFGRDYAAIEPIGSPTNVVRAISDERGQVNLFLPSRIGFHLAIFDPASGLISHGVGRTESSGVKTNLPIPQFLPSADSDTDADGLPDDIEFAIGSSPKKVDSDGDGLDDFAEIRSGSNPIAGLGAPTGVVGAIQLDVAKAVAVQASSVDPSRTLLYAATDQNTLAVVDVTQPTRPVVLNAIDMPLDAHDLAVDPTRSLVIVVGPTGVAFVDVQDPAEPTVQNTLELMDGFDVKIGEGSAFVKTPSRLVTIDLKSLAIEQTLLVEGSTGLAVEGDHLFVANRDKTEAYEIHQGRLRRLSASLPAVGEPSVANDVLYLSSKVQQNGVGGYSTIDVSFSRPLEQISGPDIPSGFGAEYTALTHTGAGVAVANNTFAGRVDILDTSDPQETNRLITAYAVPGVRSLAVAGRTAYLAQPQSGLITLLNFLNVDTGDTAPQATVRVHDEDPAAVGVQVSEGKEFTVDARVSDDVQIQSVDLLVNGQTVQTSRTFPFNFSVAAPSSSEQPSVTIQTRAVDVGGNLAFSDLLDVQVVADPSPLMVIYSDLDESIIRDQSYRSTYVQFSKPLASATATSESFELVAPNGDQIPIEVTLEDDNRRVRLNFPSLEENTTYTLVIHSSDVTDRAGRPLQGSDIRKSLSIFGDRSIVFTGRSPDPDDFLSWDDPQNWSLGRVPQESDNVQLGLPHDPVKVIVGGNSAAVLRVRSLVSYGTVEFHKNVEIAGPVSAQNLRFWGDFELMDARTRPYTVSATIGGGLVSESLTAGFVNLNLNGAARVAQRVYLERVLGDFHEDVEAGSFEVGPVVVLTLRGDVTSHGAFKQGVVSHVTSMGSVTASEFAFYGGQLHELGTFTGGTLLAEVPTRIRTEPHNPNGFGPVVLNNVAFVGDFEVVGGVVGGPIEDGVGFQLDGGLLIDGTIQGLELLVVGPSTLTGSATLINPIIRVVGTELTPDFAGNLTIGPDAILRGAWEIRCDYGGQVRSQAKLFADEPSLIWSYDSNLSGNPLTRFESSGPITVADASRLVVEGNRSIFAGQEVTLPPTLTTRPSFISSAPISVGADAELVFVDGTARLARIDAEAGATVLFGGVLYPGVNGSTETILSGPADWIAVSDATGPYLIAFTGVAFHFQGAWAGVFRDGTVTLQNGAVLTGSGILRDLTLNGTFQVQEPPPQYRDLFNFYRHPGTLDGGFLQIDRQFALNGSVLLGDETGSMGAQVVLPSILDGAGEIHVGRKPDNKLSAPLDLTVGPDITLFVDAGTVEVGGTLNLDGKITANMSGLTGTLVTNTINNHGTVIAENNATLVIRAAELGNEKRPRDLAHGLWRAASGGTLEFADPDLIAAGGIQRNAATLEIDGAGSRVVLPGAHSAFQALENVGQVRLTNGGTLIATSFTQLAGTTVFDDGIIRAPHVLIRSGTLSGAGVIDGSLTNRAVLLLDRKSGSLRVTGDYHQSSWARTSFEVAGKTPGVDYQQLAVDGRLQLVGTVDVQLTDGYLPAVEDRLPIMSFGSLGELRMISLPTVSLPAGGRFVPFRTETTVDLLVATSSTSLTLTPSAINQVRNEPTEVTVASLIDAAGQGAAEDYSAILAWGDGTYSLELIRAVDTTRLVRAAHRYSESGPFNVQVTVIKSDGTLTEATTTATVTPQTLDITLATPAFVQGVTYASTKLATFVDLSGNGSASEYVAAIDWGDGSVETGQVTAVAGGFEVSGSHLYIAAGELDFQVTVQRGAKNGQAGGVRAIAAPAPLVVSTTAPEVPVGELVQVLVATFVDPDEIGSADNYQATIFWEGGVTPYSPVSTGTIRFNAATGLFEVWGTNYHTFGAIGVTHATFGVRTEISKTHGGTGSVDSVIHVVIPDRLLLSFNFPFLETNTSYRNLWLASFSDLRGLGAATLYHATINWGDGSTSPGLIDLSNGDARILVGDNHQYAASGFYDITISLTKDDGPSATASKPTFVYGGVVALPMEVTPLSMKVYEGATIQFFPIAALKDPNADQPASGYSVTIDWGDGASTAGTVKNGISRYEIYGTHSYSGAGNYSVKIHVLKVNGATADATTTIQVVAPLPLSLTAIPLVVLPTSGPEYLVATLSDPNHDALLANGYPTTIDWGDGTTTSGRVVATSPGFYNIYGTHVYSQLGTYTMKVTAARTIVAPATISATASVSNLVVEHEPLIVQIAPLGLNPAVAYNSLFLGTFVDPEGSVPTDTYTATIDWGDGIESAGAIEPDSGNPGNEGPTNRFNILGNHTYNSPGDYTLKIRITKSNGASGLGTRIVFVGVSVPRN